jgi:hypothetical protein
VSSPAGPIRDLLEDQLATSWKLLDLHLADLGDDECLWQPAPRGPHVVEDAGAWRAAWPESEDYETGPASIAWLTWHIGFWWSMVLDHSFGDGTLQREDVTWPGSADATRGWLTELHDEWAAELAALPDRELVSTERARWPFTDRPFHRVAAWVNLELMKNASEIGYCRFLYAAR